MDETNIEIVVTPGNWQRPGMPLRWNWQVRRKTPIKVFDEGHYLRIRGKAYNAAKGAKAKVLERTTTKHRFQGPPMDDDGYLKAYNQHKCLLLR